MKDFNTKDMARAKIKALLYGLSGSGKTHSILTLPTERTLALLVEPKHLPLVGKDVDAWSIDNWKDLQESFKAIREKTNNGGLEVNGRKKDIIVIDSLSEANEVCKQQIVTKDRPEMMERNKKELGGIYDEQMTMQDWGLLSTRIENMVSAFNHLDAHVIFLCLEQWTEDKKTGEQYVTPYLNGKLPLSIPHHFDMVFRLETEQDRETGSVARFFRTQSNGKAICKGSAELDNMEPANWSKLLGKIMKKKGGK